MNWLRPTKHDLKQLDLLISKGVKLDYIQQILDITPQEFERWTRKANVWEIISRIPESRPEKFNIYHPDLADQIEEAFECGLIKYYRFKSEFRLPTGRYKYHYKYLQLNAIKTDPELLKSEVQEARSWLSGERKKIDIGNAMQVLYKIETRASLPFDPELARKLASVSYFTDDEDLSTFYEEHGEKKIAHWKEHNFNDFFLMTPVAELLNLKNISITSLEAYLTEAQDILQALTLETPK